MTKSEARTQLMHPNSYIRTVSAVRELTGCNVTDAKFIVDMLVQNAEQVVAFKRGTKHYCMPEFVEPV
jgi:ribosomal protein L7/L12